MANEAKAAAAEAAAQKNRLEEEAKNHKQLVEEEKLAHQKLADEIDNEQQKLSEAQNAVLSVKEKHEEAKMAFQRILDEQQNSAEIWKRDSDLQLKTVDKKADEAREQVEKAHLRLQQLEGN